MALGILVFAAAVSAGAGAAAPVKHTAAECAVWDRVLSFSKSVERKDKAAAAAHIYPTGVFSSETSGAFVGPKDISDALWAETVEYPADVKWRPVTVSIGRDPNHAIVIGVRISEDKSNDADAAVRYISYTFRHIWRRDPTTKEWKVEFDGYEGEIGYFGSRAELDAELAKAPKACPR